MQESEVYFIQDIYSEHLTIINGVSFTRREIDIISCLLSARGTSKIASLLCVSPKTVVSHIRNIMLKLECNSRESIIDFIENSNKISIVRKYYLGLLIDIAFEKNLQQISKFKVINPSLYFIVYWQDQRLKTSLEHHLAHHLKLAGIITKVQEQELSQKIIRSQNSNHMLFLLIKKEKQQEIPLEHLKNESIDTSKNENYYACVFEILKKIYLADDVNRIFKQFKEYYNNIQYPSERKSKAFLKNPNKKIKSKIYFYILINLFLIFFGCFFYKYYNFIDINFLEGSSTNLNLKQEKKKITSYIPNILTKYETFIDRKENLDQINKLFSKNNVIVITGRPGIGKSCLAAEYAKEQDRIVRYVDADSSEKIAQKYRELGQEFGIDLINQPRNLVMKLVNNHLNTIPCNFLFIFDNVNNYDSIKDYIFNIPENVKVLITTTNPNLILNSACITLKKFPPKEAKEYLNKCLYNRNLTDEEKISIIEKVSTLPYDLKCTVAYLLENFTIPIQELVDNIGNKIDTKLFGQLAKNENRIIAWQILQYAAYLDPDFIDINILKNLFSKDFPLVIDAIKTLESLSLVSIIYDSNNRAGLRVHRELQREVKKSVNYHPKHVISERQIINNILIALENLFPVVDHKPGASWYEADKIVIHIKKILKENKDDFVENKELEAKIYYKLGRYHFAVDINRPQALKHAKNALEIRKTLLPLNYSDVADSLESVGNIHVCNNLKDIQEGIRYIKASLKVRKNLYTGNHPTIATTLRNIGIAYLTAEEKEKELQYMQESLKMRQLLYQDNHHEIAESLNDLAWCYYELGNYKSAKHYIEQSVHMFKALYPKGDPSTIYALHTLGVLMIEEKNTKEGLKILHQALDIAINFHMDGHFTTAFIFYDLGRGYLQNNDYKNALVHTMRGLKIRENLNKVNGKRNLMDQSLHILGDIYRLEGKREKAISMYKQALEVQKNFSLTSKPESLEIEKKIKELTNDLTNNSSFFYYLQKFVIKISGLL